MKGLSSMGCPMRPQIHGAGLDEETRCAHWAGATDVVAFRFRCCNEWYACRACHDDAVDHEADVWRPCEVDEHAVYCGACKQTMTIEAYLACEHSCPRCGAAFNPGCQTHWDRYFLLEA